MVALNIEIIKLHLFMKFGNIVDWDIFVDMHLLKSPIIIGEKFIGIFSSIVSKIQVK
jgi:hypothetical protein